MRSKKVEDNEEDDFGLKKGGHVNNDDDGLDVIILKSINEFLMNKTLIFHLNRMTIHASDLRQLVDPEFILKEVKMSR